MMNTTFNVNVYDKEISQAGMEHSTLDLVLLLLHLILVIPIIITNVLILLALQRFPSLQTPTNVFVGSLALTDLLTGLVSSPGFALVHHAQLGLEKVQVYCVGSYIISHGPTGVSMLTLLVIAIERYIAVHYPYAYQRHFSVTVAVLITVMVWLYAWITIVTVLLTTNKWQTGLQDCNFGTVCSSSYKAMLMGHMILTLLIASILYIKIARVASYHAHQIAKQSEALSPVPSRRRRSSTFSHNQVMHNAKIAKMLFTVLGLFYLCWLPYLFTMPFAMRVGEEQEDPFWLHIWEQIGGIVVLCNSFINFIVYAMKSVEFRRAFRKLLRMRLDDASSSYGTDDRTQLHLSSLPNDSFATTKTTL